MVKRTIIYFLLFTTSWLVFTSVKQWPSKSISQWEDNDRLINNFLFSENKSKLNTIIVGSSMAFRMTIDQNPVNDSIFNLSLGGQSIYEGLEILQKSGHAPKYLLIESNVIFKDKRENYAASFFLPGIYHLKKKFRGLRQAYRPITFAQYVYFGLRNKIHSHNPTSNTIVFKNDSSLIDNENILEVKQSNLEKIINNYSEILNNTEWNNIYKNLQYYLTYFNKKGTSIIFFEMPSEQAILESNLNLYIHSFINKNWPSLKFIKANKAITTDGVHLSPDVAKQYLPVLLEKITK